MDLLARACRSRRSLGLVLALGCACVFAAAPARAQLEIRVDDPAITLTPTPADYNQDFVDATGSNGIRLRVKTQNPLLGCHVFVRCSDAAPQIALNDLMVRTTAPPGAGGTALSVFTPISAVNQTLWSSGQPLPGFSTQLTCDVRVRNLMNYNDSPMAGTTAYQNTLTFTILSP
jgi:hypothetical protein